jgi:dTDP-4-amino-4,6-dideoxygalactose transaminase
VRIAGGMFGLEAELAAMQVAEPPFMREPRILFLSARCGMKYLVDNLRPTHVWMPSFLCCSMLEAIDTAVSNLRFYPIGYDLKIESTAWLDEVNSRDIVVLIDYFGFPCDANVAADVRERGAFVLEDASQALLTGGVGNNADFVVFSPRKTVGVPDGGILWFREPIDLPLIQLASPPVGWWIEALESVIARREFDRHGGERKWFDNFRHVENTYPVGPYRMSELAEVLLAKAFDYAAIADARRSNYRHLFEAHPQLAVCGELDDQTVPLGFPIRIKRRQEVQRFLFANSIYPPVHWLIADCVPDNFVHSHQLSEDIMTIPCDHRLTPQDIDRISSLIASVLRGK